MSSQLQIAVGQHSDKGRKAINQDFHGMYMPEQPLLSTKGIAIALADGISSSEVSQIASESAVKAFLEDYYCTSETWTVKKSAQRVLLATNSWLYSQTRQSQYRYDMDRGYVCTLSAMIIKSTTAHCFHIGDARIYRLQGKTLEQLTNDHRLRVSPEKCYLSRALGIDDQVEIDYQAFQVVRGDIFLLATDGVYEHIRHGEIINAISDNRDDLDAAARRIVQNAYTNGSDDNLTVQLVVIDDIPDQDAHALYQQSMQLSPPPVLNAGMALDGFTIIRELHVSHRSHVYLAIDEASETQVALKTPSVDMQDDPVYRERFLMEEWVARRIDNPHVVKAFAHNRQRHYLYTVTEFVEAQTLTQWMIDNPRPSLETVRAIVEQIAKGLQAFHRLEMVHQDVRPGNILIDDNGTVKLIDFGATRVAGIMEIAASLDQDTLLGTAAYSAPEYFLGESGSARSDIFSLGVITYQMLTGKLPYGTMVAQTKTRAAQHKLKYRSALTANQDIPAWLDEVLKKAVHPSPLGRYEALSAFIFELRHPNRAFLNKTRPPLIERDPVSFWKGVCLILMIVIVVLLIV
ncbi:bifunctional protein-serine/threonine kinase/phosphatase [Halomonas sp. TRM85114]|nr:bifunctional protein-serine/threonine kinase/phosphatase [Halomonas jincaotanensis]